MQILKHIAIDILKSRIVLFYALFLFILTTSILWFDGGGAKAIITLQNITLLAAPLIALVFSSTYMYNSRDFIALLLTQPIERKTVFWAFLGAMAFSLTAAIFIGFGIPILLFGYTQAALTLLYLTLSLNLVFVALGMWVATRIQDKAKGLGAALLIWLTLTLLYDGVVLLVLNWFQEYPLMTPIVILTSLNPIDLTRVSLLLEMDISALMGFTGAVYQKYFSSGQGAIITFVLLALWAIIPTWLSKRKFLVKDF